MISPLEVLHHPQKNQVSAHILKKKKIQMITTNIAKKNAMQIYADLFETIKIIALAMATKCMQCLWLSGHERDLQFQQTGVRATAMGADCSC